MLLRPALSQYRLMQRAQPSHRPHTTTHADATGLQESPLGKILTPHARIHQRVPRHGIVQNRQCPGGKAEGAPPPAMHASRWRTFSNSKLHTHPCAQFTPEAEQLVTAWNATQQTIYGATLVPSAEVGPSRGIGGPLHIDDTSDNFSAQLHVPLGWHDPGPTHAIRWRPLNPRTRRTRSRARTR